MPVAALCAKLIKGKILRGSVIMVTSRPDESDNMNRIRFDRYVEITGFSEEQVKEYIGKYFKKDEDMKNIVLDHIMKNDELVSFAHIPVLCFLMCSYMEYILKESTSSDYHSLPVKTSDLYFEVVNRFVLDHNKKEIPSESTLDKLSELAAQWLLEKKFCFVGEDMETFSFEEVERLRASGLLHCGPPFRRSFSQVTKHFCFIHLTLQEYLAARWFVKRKAIPSTESVSSMVMQFMSGILSKRKDNELMERLLEALPSSNRNGGILLRAKCLTEYEDKQFAKNIIKKHRRYFVDEEKITFPGLTDADCVAVSFLLETLSALNEEEADAGHQTFSEQAFILKGLEIHLSSLTQSGLRRICNSLEKDICSVTELTLSHCPLDVDCIRGLVSSKLTKLALYNTLVTSAGVVSLSQVLQSSACQVTSLDLSGNQITDAGVVSLSQALQSSACQVTSLDLSHNQIIDSGVVSLSQALQSSACQVTSLDLSANQITDTGVVSLSQALQSSACQVTSLDLSYNQITDAGVVSLSQALQSSACQVTSLDLRDNQITDAGEKPLRHSERKKPNLDLNY